MRFRFFSLCALSMLCAVAPAHAAAKTYYLALGDSLAVGVQPSANGDVPTNQGYADDVYAALHRLKPELTLVKLGCPGETTGTMISGGICAYDQGSQLAEAEKFLATHEVVLVTIDIGANDVDGCVDLNVTPPQLDQGCVNEGGLSVAANLPYILHALRCAAGPGTTIVGMNYYDPFLAAWELGPAGQSLAEQSVTAATEFNALLQTVYQAFDVPVADVAKAYHITDFNPVPVINLPINVFLTLTWTWMGAPPPLGPDIHANAAGYAVIAGAFLEQISKLLLAG
jgi:lysophospholipase L1-like esterase